jgi:hypothetical protein
VGGDDAEEILSDRDRKANDYFALIRASGDYTLGVRSAIDDRLLLIDNFSDIPMVMANSVNLSYGRAVLQENFINRSQDSTKNRKDLIYFDGKILIFSD